MRFHLRDLFWLTLVVAVGLAVWLQGQREASRIRTLYLDGLGTVDPVEAARRESYLAGKRISRVYRGYFGLVVDFDDGTSITVFSRKGRVAIEDEYGISLFEG